MYTIIRHKQGRAPTRHGIVLKFLAPRHQEVLLKNYHIKNDCADDRFLQIIFKMKDDEINNIKLRKLYINPKTHEIDDYVNLKRQLQLIDWTCAECGKSIKSNITKFIPENFLCKRCKSIVKYKQYIPETIIDSSYRFMLHCKNLMKLDQSKFIKYIKHNEK